MLDKVIILSTSFLGAFYALLLGLLELGKKRNSDEQFGKSTMDSSIPSPFEWSRCYVTTPQTEKEFLFNHLVHLPS